MFGEIIKIKRLITPEIKPRDIIIPKNKVNFLPIMTQRYKTYSNFANIYNKLLKNNEIIFTGQP